MTVTVTFYPQSRMLVPTGALDSLDYVHYRGRKLSNPASCWGGRCARGEMHATTHPHRYGAVLFMFSVALLFSYIQVTKVGKTAQFLLCPTFLGRSAIIRSRNGLLRHCTFRSRSRSRSSGSHLAVVRFSEGSFYNIVQIQPRKRGLHHAENTTLTRQHELGHTDWEHVCPERSGSSSGGP